MPAGGRRDSFTNVNKRESTALRAKYSKDYCKGLVRNSKKVHFVSQNKPPPSNSRNLVLDSNTGTSRRDCFTRGRWTINNIKSGRPRARTPLGNTKGYTPTPDSARMSKKVKIDNRLVS